MWGGMSYEVPTGNRFIADRVGEMTRDGYQMAGKRRRTNTGQSDSDYRSVFALSNGEDKLNIMFDELVHIRNSQDKMYQVCTEDLVLLSHVEWFIQSVVGSLDSFNSSIISFALHLVGWLGETENGFVRYKAKVENALSTVLKWRGYSNDFSTLTVVYESLSKNAGHPTGLRWILTDLGDVIQQSYSLLNSGSSVFVDRVVVSFLATAWSNSSLWSEDGDVFKEFCQNSLSQACQSIESVVKKDGKHLRLTPVLNLIEEACSRSDRLAHSVMNSSGLYSLVTNLVITGEGTDGKLAMNILKICIEKSESEVSKQLEGLADELYTKGCFKRAQELSVCLLKKGNKAPHLTSQLVVPITMAITQSKESDMLSEMSPTEFQDVLCHSIVCLEKTDIAICPDVVKLFKISCNADDGKQMFISHRIKLQRVCLNYFLHIIDSGRLEDPAAVDIISCLIDIIRRISVDHQIYSSSLKCLLPLLPTMLGTSCHGNSKPISGELSDIIQCHLCSVQWEIRDTTLEFLSQVLEKFTDNSPVIDWFIASHLCNHTWQCLTDNDSYVRATAVICLSKMILVQPLWQALISQTETVERDIVSKVQDILKTDTEAFPRRAAVKFLQSFYSYKVKVRELYDVTVVKETLMTSSKDFDWEVKLAGLEFVKNLISQETDNSIDNCEDSVPSYAVDLVKRQKVDTSEVKVGNLLCAVCRLELYGCWKALLQAVDDYDQTVCEAADKILLDFSQTLKTVVMDTKANGSKMEEIWEVLERHLEKLEKDGIGLGFQQDKEKFSNFNHSSLLLLKPTISKESKLNSKNNELNGHDCESFSGVDFLKLGDSSEFKAEILKLIKKLMRYEAGVKVSGKTDYETNPFSLLDDILSYARKDEESNVVDCY